MLGIGCHLERVSVPGGGKGDPLLMCVHHQPRPPVTQACTPMGPWELGMWGWRGGPLPCRI